MLLGNKCDLKGQREVSQEEASLFAEKHNMAFMETSALDSTNVEISFQRLISEIYNLIVTASDEENDDENKDEFQFSTSPKKSENNKVDRT